MNNISKMKITARKLVNAIESCGDMGWCDTKTFYQTRLDKLEREIAECEISLIKRSNTRGLPMPTSTF